MTLQKTKVMMEAKEHRPSPNSPDPIRARLSQHQAVSLQPYKAVIPRTFLSNFLIFTALFAECLEKPKSEYITGKQAVRICSESGKFQYMPLCAAADNLLT